jgi:hypothetical protein
MPRVRKWGQPIKATVRFEAELKLFIECRLIEQRAPVTGRNSEAILPLLLGPPCDEPIAVGAKFLAEAELVATAPARTIAITAINGNRTL